ncbi:hypothetical protein AB0A63_14480 [Lentzea sp. NPDC042327]|uniref:hypothetical protein n=1 Tax=Lentzea sp. NPDC042327 TaxID=3154801 RepID=UPI0033C8684A
MTEWTLEAVNAEIAYRRANARCTWQRSNGGPRRWFHRVIHRTSRKHGGTSP